MGMHSLFDNFYIQFYYNFEAMGRPKNYTLTFWYCAGVVPVYCTNTYSFLFAGMS